MPENQYRIKRAAIPKNASGIYEIRFKANGKTYIGSAINFKVRKYHHFHDLEGGEHCNIYLQRHANKYGLSDLQFLILEFCTKEKLIKKEQHYINILQPEFNICKIAGSSFGTLRSEESKEKMRGKNNPMYGISRCGEEGSMYGKHHSKETRQKMSKAHKEHLTKYWLGKPFSKEHREKIGRKGEENAFYGKQHTKETKQKLSALRTGTHMSEETRKKMSTARILFYKTERGKLNKQKISDTHKGRIPYSKGFVLTEQIKQKISKANSGENNAMYGKQHTEETKQKMREAWKRRKNVVGEVSG